MGNRSKRVTYKQDKNQDQDKQLRLLIGDIMTRNTDLSKEEYCEKLKSAGLLPKDVDKVDDVTRLARIRSNYYGTMVNMNFSLLQSIEELKDEVETQRAILNKICEKLGIDTADIKTASDRLNETAEEYLRLQNEAMKKSQK